MAKRWCIVGLTPGSCGSNVEETENNNNPIYLRAYDLHVQGYTARRIAQILYGRSGERELKRVYRLIRHARDRVASLSQFDGMTDMRNYAAEIVGENVGGEGDFIRVKINWSKDRYTRQFITHTELLYHFMGNAGFKTNTKEHYTAYSYHKRLFPLAWERWGEKLRCWRNGKSKGRPFSFTWHSLSYTYALARGVLTLYGYHTNRARLDKYVESLLGVNQKRTISMFYRLYADVGGWVLGMILHPTFVYATA